MNTFVPSPGFDASRFKGTTLILPAVSIGNVPQLATDLLLSTLKLDRVGCIEDENVIPVLGARDRPQNDTASSLSSSTSLSSTSAHATPGAAAGSHGALPQATTEGLSLAVEVFQSKDGKWTLIQQRSPTVPHRSHFYADNLVRFMKESEFDQVVLLASADGARRIDIQLRSGSPVRYIGSGSSLEGKVRELGIGELENVATVEDEERMRREMMQRQDLTLASGLVDRVQDIQLEEEEQQKVLEKVPRIPNGGIARRLHSLCREEGIAILTLVVFAMEGDNAPDAIFLANVLNAVLQVHIPNEQQVRDGEGWKVPKSWDSLYGNTYHQDMYQ